MSGSETGPERWPNREYYLKAALIGGGTSALLSVIPVISWLNIFFFCLVMLGGGVSVYWVQRKTGTVDALEGAMIGALSGGMAGLLSTALGFCGMTLIVLVTAPNMSSRELRELGAVVGAMFGATCCITFLVYPLMSALGGLFGAMIWPPTSTGSGAGPAQSAEPSEAEVAKRKKLIRVVLGALSGCLLLMILVSGLIAYLVSLEARDVDDTGGEEEVVSAPIVLGERMVIEIEETGGTTRYGIWLVAEDDLPTSMYQK